jgi:hypothetical protein
MGLKIIGVRLREGSPKARKAFGNLRRFPDAFFVCCLSVRITDERVGGLKWPKTNRPRKS